MSIPKLTSQLREFHEQQASGYTFQPSGDVCDGKLQRSGNKTMDMVHLPNVNTQYGETFLFADLFEQFAQPLCDRGGSGLYDGILRTK